MKANKGMTRQPTLAEIVGLPLTRANNGGADSLREFAERNYTYATYNATTETVTFGSDDVLVEIKHDLKPIDKSDNYSTVFCATAYVMLPQTAIARSGWCHNPNAAVARLGMRLKQRPEVRRK